MELENKVIEDIKPIKKDKTPDPSIIITFDLVKVVNFIIGIFKRNEKSDDYGKSDDLPQEWKKLQ